MAFYTVRSDRLFCEQLDYNLLFRYLLRMTKAAGGADLSPFGLAVCYQT